MLWVSGGHDVVTQFGVTSPGAPPGRPDMQTTVAAMGTSVSAMDASVSKMQTTMAALDARIGVMSADLKQMGNTIALMQHSAANLDQSIGPAMGTFNRMMPFGWGGNYPGSPPYAPPMR